MGLVGLYGLALHRLTCPELPLTSRVPTSMDRGRQVENGTLKCKLAKSVLSYSLTIALPCSVAVALAPGQKKALDSSGNWAWVTFFNQFVFSETTWQEHHCIGGVCMCPCFPLVCLGYFFQLYLTNRKPKLKLLCSFNSLSSYLL